MASPGQIVPLLFLSALDLIELQNNAAHDSRRCRLRKWRRTVSRNATEMAGEKSMLVSGEAAGQVLFALQRRVAASRRMREEPTSVMPGLSHRESLNSAFALTRAPEW